MSSQATLTDIHSMIIISGVIFLSGQKKYVKVPPQGSAIIDALKVTSIAVRERGFVKAQPSKLQESGHISKYNFAQSAAYTDTYVKEVSKGVKACRVFLFLPFYFVCWIQIWNNLISQAGQMALHGTPNDLLQNLDPIALIIFIPLLDCKSPHYDLNMTDLYRWCLSSPSKVQNRLHANCTNLHRIHSRLDLHGICCGPSIFHLQKSGSQHSCLDPSSSIHSCRIQ